MVSYNDISSDRYINIANVHQETKEDLLEVG